MKPHIEGKRALLSTIGRMQYDAVRMAVEKALPVEDYVQSHLENDERYSSPGQESLWEAGRQMIEDKRNSIDPFSSEEYKSEMRRLDLLERAARE